MAAPFALATDMILVVKNDGIASNQLIENKFDIRITGIGVGSTTDLLLQLETDWTASVVPVLSVAYQHFNLRAQRILGAAAGASPTRPKRVLGLFTDTGPVATMNGGVVGLQLPTDVVATTFFNTATPGKKGIGRKQICPLPSSTLDLSENFMTAAARTAMQNAMATWLVGLHPIGVTGFSYQPGLWDTKGWFTAIPPGPPLPNFFYAFVAATTNQVYGQQTHRKRLAYRTGF